MSDEFARYAVYWVPRWPNPLAAFGVSWTGWCAERGEVRERGTFPGLPANGEGMIRRLRLHGLHGVIRTPFALAPGRSLFSVEHVLDDLAEELVAFQLPRLELALLDGRVALAPVRSPGALATLMRRVDEALAPLTARAGANGHASGRLAGLAEAPGVAPDVAPAPDPSVLPFPGERRARFHVPLTDPMPIERADAARGALSPLVAPRLGAPQHISELAPMGDPGGGRPLRVLRQYELRDWPLRRNAHALPCHGPRVLAPMPEARRPKADAAV